MIKSMMKKTICGLGLAVGLIALTGCSDDDDTNSPNQASGTYTGTFADDSGSAGTVDFDIPAAMTAGHSVMAAVIQIVGEVVTPSATIPLTGTYNSVTGALSLSGGGYAFSGTFTDGHFTGDATTPTGTGFFVAIHGNSAQVQVYCGTFTRCNDPLCLTATDIGTLNVALSGSLAVGALQTTIGEGAVIGTVTGGDTVDFDFVAGSSTVHVGGTIVGTTLSGDWAEEPAGGDVGFWSTDTANCI